MAEHLRQIAMKVKVLVLCGYGINCDNEMLHGFELAGADAERVHVNELITGERKLRDYQILALPGGFSFGDDISAGKVLATRFRYNLEVPLHEFVTAGKLIIGVCNGFQAMVKLGILPGLNRDYRTQRVTLTFNDSGRFENRWVYLDILESDCVFTRGMRTLYLPVRHGEGKFVPKDPGVLERLYKNKQVVARYVDAEGNENPAYPWNPNGSIDGIAAICDETGRIFGMMPHPEAYLYATNHPCWTRQSLEGTLPSEGMGLQLFRNAIEHVIDS